MLKISISKAGSASPNVVLSSRTHSEVLFLLDFLPPGWQEAKFPDDGSCVKYFVEQNLVTGIYTLASSEDGLLQTSSDLEDLGYEFNRQLRIFDVRSSNDLYVHSGVIGCNDSAIVIPGQTFSGKTTLVKAFLDVGNKKALYYSDEYALINSAGFVCPYPRAMTVRTERGRVRVDPKSLGARIGVKPIRIALIVSTCYEYGALWDPKPMTPGQSLLSLLENTPMAREKPESTLQILAKAVAPTTLGFTGVRGDAYETAISIWDTLRATGTDA